MDTHAFWRRVKSLAIEKDVTQKAVAQAIGIPLNTLKKWMSKTTIPPLDYTIELSGYFDVSIEYLVFGQDKNPKGTHSDKFNCTYRGCKKGGK